MESFDGTLAFSQHHLSNVTIELDIKAGRAASECYVLAFHPRAIPRSANGAHRDAISVVGGRYLDRWLLRSGSWAIIEREMVVDWSRRDLDGQVMFDSLDSSLSAGIGESDPSWSLLRR